MSRSLRRSLALLLLCVHGCSGNPAPSGNPDGSTPDQDAPDGDGDGPDDGGSSESSGLEVTLWSGSEAITATKSMCTGECIELRAEVAGKAGPFDYSWSDSSLKGAGPHRLCPSADVAFSVTVKSQGNGEFTENARGSASTQVTVKSCEVSTCQGGSANPHARAFSPKIEWEWNELASYVSPLVASFTDDNGDEKIDQKDTPDVVITAIGSDTGHLVVLDGATGHEHFRIQGVSPDHTPAVGDIDGDGLVDIVTMERFGSNFEDVRAVAYSSTRARLWSKAPAATECPLPNPMALADLDHDGDPEVIGPCEVYSSTGELLWTADAVADSSLYAAATAVDLDGDGMLEVVWGPVAYRHDGTPYYTNNEAMNARWDSANKYRASFFTAIADLDQDEQPEVVVATPRTLFVLDNAGKTLRKTPLMEPQLPALMIGPTAFPVTVYDLDGDGLPEILLPNGDKMVAYDAELALHWDMPVHDESGIAAATAFDFSGDGNAEVIYNDEKSVWAFAGDDGHVVFSDPRTGATGIEYAVVVDVDNDESAEILVVSSLSIDPERPQGLRVYGDANDGWMPARSLFNQDTYHVTNINDDGTIPAFEKKHWLANNTFRAQGQVCKPNGGSLE